MTKEQLEKQQNKGLRSATIVAALLFIMWVIYLIFFYAYYKEAYFYIDKRLTLFYQLLILVHDNLVETIKYLSLGVLLMTITFVHIYFIFLSNKRNPYPRVSLYILSGLNAIYFLLLLINVYGFIFFILSILSGSIIYALVIIGNEANQKVSTKDYEEGDILETTGPFETKEIAQREAGIRIEKLQENPHLVLGEELYQEENNYYIDIYIEAIKK
ncbi:hypothetical protein A5821_002151 [Enterococcus sp. 7F3_DIV0205]|uniref:Uncharacterized protein n=1 Tax=Candidatus Enterococcus palustris TaxID=1834189 RepID=A0AAQ3Y5H0_9ENTE|nr:hypothetical protein [Enterococcus sp. 7F3_DIV0205]OTN82590.1 hypothetical protein A5821_002501 [Enterococcus sp. 7F3_DIV0205]